MNEKHQEVELWLDDVFGGEERPAYEVSTKTVEILWQMKQRSEQQDRAMGLVTEDLHMKASEYALETERLSRLLSDVGLSSSSLSQSAAVSLRTLVSMALILRTKDTSSVGLMLALSEASQSAASVSEAQKLEKKLLSQLFTKNKAAFVKYSNLQKALQSLDKAAKAQGPELEKKAQKAAFLQSKGQEYRQQLAKLQEVQLRTGADPAIHHDALLRQSEHLEELRDQLRPIRARLDSYQQLPPNLALAKVKLEEMRTELENLDKKINSIIDGMHT